jgi:hypothetical protein
MEKCKHEGCQRYPQRARAGYCIKHGKFHLSASANMIRYNHEGYPNNSVRQGVCWSHGARIIMTGATSLGGQPRALSRNSQFSAASIPQSSERDEAATATATANPKGVRGDDTSFVQTNVSSVSAYRSLSPRPSTMDPIYSSDLRATSSQPIVHEIAAHQSPSRLPNTMDPKSESMVAPSLPIVHQDATHQLSHLLPDIMDPNSSDDEDIIGALIWKYSRTAKLVGASNSGTA